MKKLIKKNTKNSNLVQNDYFTNPLQERELLPLVFSKRVIDLYEKQADIKKFAKLVLEDEITDEFLNNAQAELLMKDVFNPFDENCYKKLVENEQLLKDLTSDTNMR